MATEELYNHLDENTAVLASMLTCDEAELLCKADEYAMSKAEEYAESLGAYIKDPAEQQAIHEVYSEAYREYMKKATH